MTRSKAIALLITLFLAGAMAGGFVGFNVGRRQVSQAGVPIEHPKPPPGPNSFPRPPGRMEKTRDRLSRELELTEEQLVKIDPIITAFDTQLETMNKRNWTDLFLAISNRNEQIKPFLTPEQLKRLEDRNMKRRGPGGPPHRDDRGSHERD